MLWKRSKRGVERKMGWQKRKKKTKQKKKEIFAGLERLEYDGIIFLKN